MICASYMARFKRSSITNLFVQQAPTQPNISMAISPLKKTHLDLLDSVKNFRKLKCEHSRWTGVFCNMSEKFRQSQRRTDPQGLEAVLPCCLLQIISWQGIVSVRYSSQISKFDIYSVQSVYFYLFFILFDLFTIINISFLPKLGAQICYINQVFG